MNEKEGRRERGRQGLTFPNAMAALAASESPMKLRTLTLAFLKLESPLLALCLLGTWNSIMMDVDSFPSLPSSNAKDSPDVMPSPEATMKASPIVSTFHK